VLGGGHNSGVRELADAGFGLRCTTFHVDRHTDFASRSPPVVFFLERNGVSPTTTFALERTVDSKGLHPNI